MTFVSKEFDYLAIAPICYRSFALKREPFGREQT
jgi:hypothetical protein